MDAPYGQLETLAPGIARLLAPNPSPFTFTGTQTYIVGERELVVIDPGPEAVQHLAAIQRAVAGRPVAAILCTHTHRDHSPGAKPLAAALASPIIGCAPLALPAESSRADAAFDFDYAPDRVLGDGETLEFGGGELAAIATPGHTSNHLCFAFGDALFTGDHVMGWSTTVVVPPDGDMADYMRSLDKLRWRDDAIYYPAHGPAVTKPQQYVRSLIGHRMQRERQVLGLVQGRARSISDIVASAYPTLDQRLVPAAGGSVWAHLLDLERRGLVEQQEELWIASA